jgi:hypothetical protein
LAIERGKSQEEIEAAEWRWVWIRRLLFLMLFLIGAALGGWFGVGVAAAVWVGRIISLHLVWPLSKTNRA